MFRVGSQETQASKLVNGSILEQAQLWVCNASAGYYFHIHLDPLTGIGHLLIRLGFIRFFLLGSREQPQLSHNPEQALRAAGIAPLPQPVPQFHHAQVWITAAHVPDQFQLCLCMLVGVTARPPGLTGQRFAPFRPSVPSRSRYTTGSCYTSGWHGSRRISLHISSGIADMPCPVLYSYS